MFRAAAAERFAVRERSGMRNLHYFKGSIWVTRPAMIHYATPRPRMLAMASELFSHVLAGHITGEPKQEFALADAADAHRALESRRTTGATVLVP